MAAGRAATRAAAVSKSAAMPALVPVAILAVCSTTARRASTDAGSGIDMPVNKARDEAISHTSLCDVSGSDNTGSFTIHSRTPAPAGDVHAHGAHADDACGAERNLKTAICEHIGNTEVPADARSSDSVANKKAPCKA